MLIRGRQAGVERHDHAFLQATGGQQLAGFADVLLGGHEHEHVTAGAFPRQAFHGGHGRFDMAFLAALVRGLDRPVAHLDRVHPARNLDHGGIVEGPGEFFGVDGGGGDDQFEIPPALDQFFQNPQNEIDVQAAFVGFVHDQRVVGREGRIALGLRQQNAVGHDLDEAVAPGAVLKADLVAHRGAQRLAQFVGDALGHGGGGDATRLGAADQPAGSPSGGEAELGQLGRLARSGLTGHDHHRVGLDGGLDGRPVGRDGQVLQGFPGRSGIHPLRADLRRSSEPFLDGLEARLEVFHPPASADLGADAADLPGGFEALAGRGFRQQRFQGPQP